MEVIFPKHWKICNQRLSDDCTKLGHPSFFRPKSRTCNICYQVYKRNYYRDHQERMNERAKAYSKARYVPKMKPIDEVDVGNVEIAE